MWSSAFDPIKAQLILFRAVEALFMPGQLWRTPEDQLQVKHWSSLESNQTHNQRPECTILTLPWKTTAQQDHFWYLFGVAVWFDWIKLDVWLKQAFFWLFESMQNVIGLAFVPGLNLPLSVPVHRFLMVQNPKQQQIAQDSYKVENGNSIFY